MSCRLPFGASPDGGAPPHVAAILLSFVAVVLLTSTVVCVQQTESLVVAPQRPPKAPGHVNPQQSCKIVESTIRKLTGLSCKVNRQRDGSDPQYIRVFPNNMQKNGEKGLLKHNSVFGMLASNAFVGDYYIFSRMLPSFRVVSLYCIETGNHRQMKSEGDVLSAVQVLLVISDLYAVLMGDLYFYQKARCYDFAR